MGTYIYSIRKKTVEATLLPENKKVVVALAKYVCRDDESIFGQNAPQYKDHGKIRAILKKAQKMISDGFSPDFYTDDLSGGSVYIFNGIGYFDDAPSLGKVGSKMTYINENYYIIPPEANVKDFISPFFE